MDDLNHWAELMSERLKEGPESIGFPDPPPHAVMPDGQLTLATLTALREFLPGVEVVGARIDGGELTLSLRAKVEWGRMSTARCVL